MTPVPVPEGLKFYAETYPDDIHAQELNVPLFTETLSWVYAEASLPEWKRHWDQSTFIGNRPGCGTTYCFAGYTRHLAEQRKLTAVLEFDSLSSTGYVAKELLGLTAAESEYLFYGLAATVTDEPIRELAHYIFSRRGLLLPPITPAQITPAHTPKETVSS